MLPTFRTNKQYLWIHNTLTDLPNFFCIDLFQQQFSILDWIEGKQLTQLVDIKFLIKFISCFVCISYTPNLYYLFCLQKS